MVDMILLVLVQYPQMHQTNGKVNVMGSTSISHADIVHEVHVQTATIIYSFNVPMMGSIIRTRGCSRRTFDFQRDAFRIRRYFKLKCFLSSQIERESI